MISHTTIETVRDLAIYDVVSKYQDITLKKTAANTWRGTSPWTQEKTPSFYVVGPKNIFKDFSSGKGGGPVQFVMEKDGLEWIDAVKSLCSQHGIQIEYDKNPPPEETISKSVEIQAALEWACAHFCANPIPESFTKYRAFPDECLAPFKVGYANPSWNDLLKSAITAGHKPEILLQAGLIRKRENTNGGIDTVFLNPNDGYYDYFRDRIIFPVFDYRGNVVAFSGRDAETQPVKEGHEKPVKYMNSPETCYDKSRHLFGLYQAIKDKAAKDRMMKEGAYLVEGPTDVIRFHKHTFSNTVAPCGSALTEQQAKLLKRYTDKIIYVPDNDCDKPKNAGIEAMERNAPIAIKAGFTVKVLIPGMSK